MEKLELIKSHLKVGIILLLSIVIINCSYAQDGIGIGTTSVDGSAVLEVVSADKNKGVLIPRLNQSEMDNVDSPAAGLMIYNTDAAGLYYYDGGWSPVGSPKGTIVMWSGTTAPSGWAICNGANGTPNLQGRFIVGYQSSDTDYDNPGNRSTGGTTNGDTGGSESVSLTESQMPSHNHSASSGGSHSHGVTDNGHVHQQRVNSPRTLEKGNSGDRTYTDVSSFQAALTNGSVINNFSSTTGVSVNSAGTHNHTIGNAGSDNAHENRPPYYTLAYIMKL